MNCKAKVFGVTGWHLIRKVLMTQRTGSHNPAPLINLIHSRKVDRIALLVHRVCNARSVRDMRFFLGGKCDEEEGLCAEPQLYSRLS